MGRVLSSWAPLLVFNAPGLSGYSFMPSVGTYLVAKWLRNEDIFVSKKPTTPNQALGDAFGVIEDLELKEDFLLGHFTIPDCWGVDIRDMAFTPAFRILASGKDKIVRAEDIQELSHIFAYKKKAS